MCYTVILKVHFDRGIVRCQQPTHSRVYLLFGHKFKVNRYKYVIYIHMYYIQIWYTLRLLLSFRRLLLPPFSPYTFCVIVPSHCLFKPPCVCLSVQLCVCFVRYTDWYEQHVIIRFCIRYVCTLLHAYNTSIVCM